MRFSLRSALHSVCNDWKRQYLAPFLAHLHLEYEVHEVGVLYLRHQIAVKVAVQRAKSYRALALPRRERSILKFSVRLFEEIYFCRVAVGQRCDAEYVLMLRVNGGQLLLGQDKIYFY